jgi:DNA repair protein RadA/Sms
MARTKKRRQFMCSACGMTEAKWYGKCPHCGAWDTLESVSFEELPEADAHRGFGADDGGAGAGVGAGSFGVRAVRIEDAMSTAGPEQRLSTGIDELDRVFGGGVVRGSVTLLGGDPGIGKSTLLLQALGAMRTRGVRALYVTSEESAEQVRLRGERLGVVGVSGAGASEWRDGVARGGDADAEDSDQHREDGAPDVARRRGEDGGGLFVLADTNLARIADQAKKLRPAVVVIDSIQMVYKGDVDASPGSVAQLRRCCTELVYLAKGTGMAVVLVGHVTKEGQLAGPRLLEHLVDVVLYFEGDQYHAHRVVRSIKNRFGTTLEIGIFEMGGRGLLALPDGGSASASQWSARPGSVVCPVVSGSRCVLIEVQALTSTGFPGSVKRKSSGLDANRLAMIIAVLEAHGGLRLYDRDVFASAVGGVRVTEPASDAALAMAIAGAHMGRTLPAGTAVVGEVGLGGELRPATQLEGRVREAARLGFDRVVAPPGRRVGGIVRAAGMESVEATTIGQAMEELRPPATG